MQAYDDIRLAEEVEELAKRGIHKDCHGLIVDIEGEKLIYCKGVIKDESIR